MHALSSHRLHIPAAPELRLLGARLSRLFAPDGARRLPAEIRRLPERMLVDIGLDPRAVSSGYVAAVTPPDLLHSPRAMENFLATTVR